MKRHQRRSSATTRSRILDRPPGRVREDLDAPGGQRDPAMALRPHQRRVQEGLDRSRVQVTCCGVDGGWPGSCHEHELLALAGLAQALDDVEAVGLLDRGFRGMAKAREHWHAPVGDRRTKDRLSEGPATAGDGAVGLRDGLQPAPAASLPRPGPPLGVIPPPAPAPDVRVVRLDRVGGLIHEDAQVA
jgi:hypothetical protein